MSKLAKLIAVAGASTLVLAGCAANATAPTSTGSTGGSTTDNGVVLEGTLDGSGASSMGSGQEAWVAGFQQLNPGVTVNYNPTGSGTGRDQFEQGLTFFTGSDSALKQEEIDTPHPNCSPADGPMFEFPIWISPIAIIFNLDGIDSLNMTPDTVAQIFTGEITNWSDAAIADQNAGVELPDLAITAVHRSDESGTTANFTDYMSKASPDYWLVGGENAGSFEAWPAEEWGGEGAPQTSGVVDAVTNGTGTIGYADASRAGSLGVVSVKVGAEYVPYSAEAAAKIVDASPAANPGERGENDLAIELDRATEASGTYPIVLVSYLIGCNDYQDDSVVELVKGYVSYVMSEEGQLAAQANAGNAPVSAATRAAAEAILATIK